MTLPPAVDRKTCSHVVEGWWGHERAALCTPPWSVLRQALCVEHVDVAYVVVVGASSGAKRNGTRTLDASSNNIHQLVESFEASNEEPIDLTPPPPPKYRLIIDEDDDDEEEVESQPKTEIETNSMENEIVKNETLPLEDDREQQPILPMDEMETSSLTEAILQNADMVPTERIAPDPVEVPVEAPPRPRFRLIID